MKNLTLITLGLIISLSLSGQADTTSYNNMAYDKWEDGDLEGALSDFNKSIEIDSFTADIYPRGIVKIELGDYDGAIIDMNLSIEENEKYILEYPDNNSGEDAGAYYYRGFANCKLMNAKEGCVDLRKSVDLRINEEWDNVSLFDVLKDIDAYCE